MPGAGSVTRAFTGVFDPRASHASATQRARLELSLEPDGPATRLEDGPLALAWTRAGDPGTALQDRTVCILDGHVYNLSEITHDTAGNAADALARLYERRGADLLALLRGDFALVFWDRLTHTGLIARDQLGARPLHLHDSSGCLAFASELRNLTRLLPTTPAPNAAAFGEWLDAGMPAGDGTLFDGVRIVPPATYVELGLNGASTPVRYWAPRYRRPERMSVEDASAS